ncbi:hypothetical protein [Nocardia yunnanensis]|uniref:hypothetical protein n=1 Tax=Nocardia yunnanensis TaxID=2382165 RepID=UPI0013C433AE|nr:hypothetical protein [Nocardia yunnanensis]
MTTSTAPAVKKDRTFNPAAVAIGTTRAHADARWTTEDGYCVYRTGPYSYWVSDKQGLWSCQSNLDDVRADIRWLRERGR